jgi:3-methylcrotonyl-CoA carboxylase alpha subunit
MTLRRLLIANRGEIACRVIATARRMGIDTVAVHSDADAGARHVAMADRAVAIGPAPAADSYLRGDHVLQAALATGADAIHPGYGFLSENPDFAAAVAAAGLVFVGPPAAAIRAMGLKDAAKRAMERAGVPVVPGYHGADQTPGGLAERAADIGYPVLIKARAGGGGRGMRLVEGPAGFAAALASAQREAEAAFGDGAVLIERFVTRPRHVEIQVLADAHGTTLHLFERDCSLQRRHQKVIEEAPAPGMTPEVRAAMGAAAVEAARAIGYRGAGTVEFIAEASDGLRPDRFWFMEMNTRLQVEHPVTEAVTGLDLVEWQLRIAAGEALPFAQDDLRLTGCAVEARLYAEDAARGFLPATGRVQALRFPAGAAEFAVGPTRVDSGVRQGDEIGLHYDPMIAKLIAHGPDRPTALARLDAALAATQVAGCVTNRDFLRRLIAHPDVAAGRLDTGLIERNAEKLTAVNPPSDDLVALAALVLLDLSAPACGPDPWDSLRGWRAWGAASSLTTLVGGGARFPVTLTPDGPDAWQATVAGRPLWLALSGPADRPLLRTAGGTRPVEVLRDRVGLALTDADGGWRFGLDDLLVDAGDAVSGADTVLAPMPGLVLALNAVAGQVVATGDTLVRLEAMKMEHSLTAPRAGRIAELLVQDGAQVAEGDVLLRLDPVDDDG